ncbi:MAG: TIGR03087 family PEP-CTERM/XrtA system glycosyltransferase [Planctomycetaceae bacterium]
MKVLVLCHRLPFPPNRGGKIRPFHVIDHLRREHEVVVASLARSRSEERDGEGLAAHCSDRLIERIHPVAALARMVLALPTPTPSSMGYFRSPALARRLRKEIEKQRFDLIFVHCSSVAPYVAAVEGPVKVLDFGDMDSQKWISYAEWRPFPLSLGYRLEGRKLERAERALAARFDMCTVTTRLEMQTLEEYGTGARVDWFANGVDAQRFSPGGETMDPDALVFLGRMDYYPNVQCMQEFCAQVLPRIQKHRPRTTLTIVGAEPTAAVRALGQLPGVTITGSVPDVRPFARRSAVAVAPLRIARGTQNKILETMAMGVPTVASDIAARGVDVVAGEHLLVATTPEEQADAILGLLEDPREHRRLAEAGRARMLSHHSWERGMRELDRILDRTFHETGTAPLPGGGSGLVAMEGERKG